MWGMAAIAERLWRLRNFSHSYTVLQVCSLGREPITSAEGPRGQKEWNVFKSLRVVKVGLVLALVGVIAVAALTSGCVPGTTLAQTQAPAPQTAAAAPALPRTITVIGEGKVKTEPDMAQATVGVETAGPTVEEATGASAATMDAVLAALKLAGIEDKDIQTAGYNVWVDRQPSPEPRNTAEGGDGSITYRVHNNVSVTIRDLDQVGAVLDAALGAGANTVPGVSFLLADPSTVESEAREKAVADAVAKAQELARLNDVEVGMVLAVSEVVGSGGGYYNSNFIAIEAPRMGLGGGSGPISPGELELSMRLQVVYAIQ